MDYKVNGRRQEKNNLCGAKPALLRYLLFLQFISTAGGQLLSIVVLLLIYNIWELLQNYRDAILWALLCSVALRNSKDWLVHHAEELLEEER